MRKILYILTSILLFLFISAICFFAAKSTVWKQDIAEENNLSWSRIKEGWTVREDKGSNINGCLTISRIFFADDVATVLNNTHGKERTMITKDGEEYGEQPVLFFMTHNQKVRAYEDYGNGDRLIYSFGNDGTQIVGPESGNAVHCFALPEAGNRDVIVTLQFSPSFDTDQLRINQFVTHGIKVAVPAIYFGWRDLCIESFLRKSIFHALPILLMYIMGFFALFIYIASLFIKKIKIRQYLYWGIFALECATGFFCESYFGYFVARNSFLLYFISTILLAIHPSIFLVYIQEKMVLSCNKTIAKIFNVLVLFNILLICVASFCPYVPFGWLRVYICIVLELFIIFMVYSVIHETIVMSSKMSTLNKAIIFAGCCIMIDLVSAFFKNPLIDIFVFSRLGMLLFFVICAVLITNEVLDDQMFKVRSLMLEKSAYTDILTGCSNISALWRDNKKLGREKNGFSMGIINIVNITKINEVDGSAVGDNVLWTVGQMLRAEFQKESVYRMGGTKFCILLSSNEINIIEQKLNSFSEALAAYNNKNTATKIIIARSTGTFVPEEDIDFDGIYIRLLDELRLKNKEIRSAEKA